MARITSTSRAWTCAVSRRVWLVRPRCEWSVSPMCREVRVLVGWAEAVEQGSVCLTVEGFEIEGMRTLVLTAIATAPAVGKGSHGSHSAL
mmetsp:Transcript_38667/g.115527  ORF Transcript_38667/g.115527 Transcript_38667/m.115527 type:complete len:90 (+) Transcript_38667:166-435(+)